MIKRFNRYEIKYAIPVTGLDALRADLGQFLERDPYASKTGFYRVSSLYFDTPGNDCYVNKLDGLLYRRKLRIRIYPDRPDSPAFVEIKQRVNRTVQKRRLPMLLEDAYALCAGTKQLQLDSPEDQQVADEVHYLVRALRLSPRNVVTYARQAFVGRRVDPGLRLTFDTMVRTRHARFDLEVPRKMMFACPPQLAIMEVKANERIPHWLVGMLARHQCKLTRVSKYCQGLAQIGLRERYTRVLTG